MQEKFIRLKGCQTSENGEMDDPRPAASQITPISATPIPATPIPSALPAPSLNEGDAARLLQFLTSGNVDLLALARAGQSRVSLSALEGLVRQWLFDCRHSYNLAEGTIDGYAASFKRLFDYLDAQRCEYVGEEELRAFFMELAAPGANRRDGEDSLLSPRMRAIFYSNIRVFFNWCVRRRYLASSPLAHIEAPRQKKKPVAPFTKEQITKLLAAARGSLQGARDYAILMVMLDCGLRAAELCALKRCDVDFNERTVKVWHGKGDKERTVVFSPWTHTALWHYLTHYDRAPHHALFTSQRGTGAGKHLTTRGLHLLFKRLEKASGISGVRCSPHTMRHAFATLYIESGGAMEDLQKLLGHTSLSMSRHYVTQNQEYLKERHIRHSPLNLLMSDGSGKRPRAYRSAPPMSVALRSRSNAYDAPQMPVNAPQDEISAAMTYQPRPRENCGGRPRTPIESYPCSCGTCPDHPKKSCARGRVLIQRKRRERE